MIRPDRIPPRIKFDKPPEPEYNARQSKEIRPFTTTYRIKLMLFGISLIVLVIIIVLLALISGQEPIPVGQKADARRRRR